MASKTTDAKAGPSASSNSFSLAWLVTACRCSCHPSPESLGPDAHVDVGASLVHDESFEGLSSFEATPVIVDKPKIRPKELLAPEGCCSIDSESISGESKAAELVDRPVVDLGGGATYRGQWRAEHFHGMGTLTRSDGCYSGSFRNGWAHGQGRFLSASKSSFEGQWVKGKAHGMGKILHTDGSSYEGQWYCDEKCGHGIETFPDGTKYVGQFVADLKHGKGTYVEQDEGVQYKGGMCRDRMHGHGAYFFRDGRTYEGQWVYDQIHGKGVMVWPDGSRYEGEMQRNLRHGQGTFSWPAGDVYRGQWANGTPDGHGVMIDSKNFEMSGMWSAGSFVSKSDDAENIPDASDQQNAGSGVTEVLPEAHDEAPEPCIASEQNQ